MPWANGWGNYFKRIRQITGSAATRQDWATGRASELAARAALNNNSLNAMASMPDMPGMEHAEHVARTMRHPSLDAYSAFNRLVPLAASLHLAAPIKIMPAIAPGGMWTIKSDSQNRTLRDVVQADPQTGAVVGRQNFERTMLLDRLVGIGIATHEGQLFGAFNQLLGLLTAIGLVTLCVSATVLWWSRQHVGVLGAPVPMARPRWPFALFAAVLALAVYLPEFGISMVLVILTERFILSRVPFTQRWLGLVPA